MEFMNDKFPEGLRVLAVDDSSLCLKLLEALLKKCRYEVTATLSANAALGLLRKNKKNFDIVITDVQMDEMNGFELLKTIGLEMDIPVIMMSTSGDYETVMKGIEHGACDYLVKPPSLKEIQNIWQHVVRLKKNKSTLSDPDTEKKGTERNLKRRNNNQTKSNEDEDSSHSSDELLPNQKKTRISWADPELHAKFVEAFYKLGDKAVPSKILAEMNVQGLTREKVASHLQKYRKIMEKQSKKPNSITTFNGMSGRLRNSTFPSLLNLQFQNGRNYLSSSQSYHRGTNQLSHYGVTPNPSNRSFVNPHPHFLPSTQPYTSQYSSTLGTINQNPQKIQVSDSTMHNLHNQTYASGLNAQTFSSSSKLFDPHMVSSSKFPDYNANIHSGTSNFQFGEASNVLANNNLFDDLTYYSMLDHASSSNLNTVFQSDYTFNMTHSTLSGYDDGMRNMVAPTIPSTNVMESQSVDQIPSLENPLAFLETDSDHLGSYSFADDDLSAAIRPYQQQ
ncbi:hypothetical protein C5167_036710 [Papaver somniferum]|uniref:Response regulatory domain-containing protein n=2 Tax=Papaver somniferum TaxID=3469 RepID=A0A4Y7I803_PAPSO|nr:two-component response regulator ARR14-like isoform X1 [Papaver somniferum]RZC43761.1 hypothetical protein C5167_036710 [Papaver somniferum]